MSNNSVITFGCRLNAYESGVIEVNLNKSKQKNVVVVNTCAVTAEAERQAAQMVRKLKRKDPDLKIVVTGCAAQINPEKFSSMPEVSHVLGNREKMQEQYYNFGKDKKVSVQNLDQHTVSDFQILDKPRDKTRAFVEIQNGCDHKCTFCITTIARGASRSVPVGTVIEQIKRLEDQGCKEVVLTGVDLTSYGADLQQPLKLGQLLCRILESCHGISRIRLSSLDCIELDTDFFKAIADWRIMPYFHLSLQSGDDIILKRMARRHLRNQAIEVCNQILQVRPDAMLGADFIAGFPTESQDMFDNTLRLVDECNLSRLHVFPYSKRFGTAAARIPDRLQVEISERRARAATLIKVGKLRLTAFMERQVGSSADILFEKGNQGYTQHYLPVMGSKSVPQGEIVNTVISGINLEGQYLQVHL